VTANGHNVDFGWLCVEELWLLEKGNPFKTLNIPKRVAIRESRMSDLSVPVAMKSCSWSVVVALKEYASTFQGDAKASILETATYLEKLHNAYHRCLLNLKGECGRLDDLSKLDGVKELYLYYNTWITALEAEGEPVLASKGFKTGIAFQT